MAKKEIKIVIGAADEYSIGLKKAEGRFSSFGNSIGGFLKKGFAIGIKAAAFAATAIIASIAAISVAAFKMSNDFNAAMANVASLIPGNILRVRELKKEVQLLAIETGKSTEDLAGGLYEVVSAFGDAADSSEKLRINAIAATAGVSTVTEAIKLTSAVTKGYGDTTAYAVQQASDLSFMTVKLGQTTFPELAASMGKVIPIAANLELEQKRLFAGFATLTGVTGGAAEVSTQLTAVLVGMLKTTPEMAAAIKELGFNSAKAMIAELGLVGSLKALIDTTDKSSESVVKLFGRKEALTAVFALTGSQADTYATKLAAMNNVMGATDEAFDEQTKGINRVGHTWNQLKQIVTVAIQNMGDATTTFTYNALSLMLEAMKDFNKWVNVNKKSIVLWAERILITGTKAIRLFVEGIQMANNAYLKSRLIFSDRGQEFRKQKKEIEEMNEKYAEWIGWIKEAEETFRFLKLPKPGDFDFIGPLKEEMEDRLRIARTGNELILDEHVKAYRKQLATISALKEIEKKQAPEILTAGGLPGELAEVVAMQNRIDKMKEFYDKKIEIAEAAGIRESEITKIKTQKDIALEMQTNQMRIASAVSTAAIMSNTLQSLYIASGEKHKALFYAFKAFAVGQAIVSAHLGAAKALGIMGPLGIPMAKLVLTMGYAQAAAIAATGLAQGAGIGASPSASTPTLSDEIKSARTSKERSERSGQIDTLIDEGKTDEEIKRTVSKPSRSKVSPISVPTIQPTEQAPIIINLHGILSADEFIEKTVSGINKGARRNIFINKEAIA